MKNRHIYYILPAFIAVFALFGASTAQAKPAMGGDTGIGLGSGTFANGFSIKHYMGKTALQANVGQWGNVYSWGGGIAVSGDFLMEMPTFVDTKFFEMAWNVGAGVGAGLWSSNVSLAVAAVGGLEFNLKPVPIDVVLEIRPSLMITPWVNLDPFNATGHVRWYF